MECAAIEGDGTGTKGPRSTDLKGRSRVDGDTTTEDAAGCHAVDGHRAAVVDQADALCGDGVVDRADLDGVARAGEHLAVHLQGAAARAKAEDRAAGGECGTLIVAIDHRTQVGVSAAKRAQIN